MLESIPVESPNYSIIIVTHPNYTEALEKLKGDLAVAGWPSDKIYYVYNDIKDATQDGVVDGNNLKLSSNIHEYSGYFLPNKINAGNEDMFLLLHDTCRLGPDFKSKVLAAFDEYKNSKTDLLWCSSNGQCNICIFGRVTSDKALKMWGDWQILDKAHAIAMEHKRIPDSLKAASDIKQKYSRPHPQLFC